ncbi:hypothetical protein CYY_002298 [Polysphondylium violaceum]|uniref:BZIP domain-containing protein n=1 Tax=Polysphondylium violaceum TaxID=133409 RepID=A0A8J4V307_9MYCE|nr:hypothetical protein CYY_002298 [Polysphondylium violaceum]
MQNNNHPQHASMVGMNQFYLNNTNNQQQQQPQSQIQMIHYQQQQQQQQQQKVKKEKSDKPSKKEIIDSDSDEERESKKNRNRVNQNLASRNYRQRKKEYIKEIEEKLAVLALENDQLKKENLSLKKGGGVEIMKPDPAFITMMMEAKQIIIQLDVAIKKNDERSLIYLLQLFHLSIEKRHSIVEREVEKMVHPYTQAKLAAMGYVPSLESPMVSSISGPSSDGWWSQYISEAQVSEEQAKAIKQLRANHWKADIELRNEREKLDRSIKEFYLNRVMVFPTNERLNKSFANNLSLSDAPAPHPIQNGNKNGNTITNGHNGNNNGNSNNNGNITPFENTVVGNLSITNELGFSSINGNIDISEILEFTRKLEALKKNFVKQRTLMEDTHSALSSILTPKQEAMLLVRVHSATRYDFANMEMLKNVWGSVVSKDSAFPPPPPPFPNGFNPNSPTTTTTTTTTSNIISSSPATVPNNSQQNCNNNQNIYSPYMTSSSPIPSSPNIYHNPNSKSYQ